ncbi:hypothetical protein ACLBW0_17325 [Enterobacteriaceae bacterium C34A]
MTGQAIASCGYGSSSSTGYVSKKITPGDIVVQRDLPVGSVIKVFTIQENYDPQYGCMEQTWTLFYRLGMFQTPAGMPNVFSTNISGVGVNIFAATDG